VPEGKKRSPQRALTVCMDTPERELPIVNDERTSDAKASSVVKGAWWRREKSRSASPEL
jgi:hypothetical protein